MQNPILAVFPQLRRFALRPFFPCIVAASVCCRGPLRKPYLEQTASAIVANLQRQVAGELPVPVDIPQTGASFSFVRPLVLDEETKVTFS